MALPRRPEGTEPAAPTGPLGSPAVFAAGCNLSPARKGRGTALHTGQGLGPGGEAPVTVTWREGLQVSEVLTELNEGHPARSPSTGGFSGWTSGGFCCVKTYKRRACQGLSLLLPPRAGPAGSHQVAAPSSSGRGWGPCEPPTPHRSRSRALQVWPEEGRGARPPLPSPKPKAETHPPGPSPLHPLHQVGHQLVRDAGAGLLGQAEGVLQLLQRPHAPAALPVLLFELWAQHRPGCRLSPLPPPGKGGGGPRRPWLGVQPARRQSRHSRRLRSGFSRGVPGSPSGRDS